MSGPLNPPGKATLFINGWGVEIDADLLDGTKLENGDSVAPETLEALHTRQSNPTNSNNPENMHDA